MFIHIQLDLLLPSTQNDVQEGVLSKAYHFCVKDDCNFAILTHSASKSLK